MSGPGCDQPYLASDIVKNKVSSSIAHLYERPRTWLEAFYGSGWGTSSEEVANAIFANYAMGQNMLSFPCLHYSTHGSLWEWAPPDHHFRQPYWQNMDYLLKCTERLSYVLSQGYHLCDIALIYPVAPVEANLKGKESVATAFSIARDLYPAGLDFDFMDFESLARSEIKDKELNVSGERYKVLILPSMSAIRYSNVEKALDFYRAGGIVIAAGSLPEASDRIGGNDDQMQSMIKEMFGTTFSEKHDTTVVYSQKSENGGAGIFISDPLGVKNVIPSLIQPDFKVVSGNIASNILHRRAGKRDLYFVYGVPKGTECFFRCSGKVELWDPWDGSLRPLKVSSVSETGTTIRLPLEKNEPQLIVFSEGKPEVEQNTGIPENHTDTMTVDNTWEFELKPTLDNRYGDYRLPAFEGKLGVEIWKMKYAEENSPDPGWQDPHFDDSNWQTVSVSYGPQLWKLGPIPATSDSSVIEAKLANLEQIDIDKPVDIKNRKYFWEPYEFSWRWGLKDDQGHQGYHGMKGKVNNELISLGKINRTRFFYPVYSLEKENEGSVYYLWSTVSSSDQMNARINIAKLSRAVYSAYNKTLDYRGQIVSPQKVYLNHILLEKNQDEAELRSGSNPVLLKYNKTGRGYYIFENSQINIAWKQSIPLATESYLKPSVLPFNYLPQLKDLFGWYRFMCPPGARTMIVQSVTKPKVWIGGNEISCGQLQPVPVRMVDKNMPVWKIDLPDTLLNSSLVALRIELKPGFYGGAAIPEPVLFDCGKGKIRLGNLNENESLKTYSGGMWYRKNLNLTAEQVSSPGIILDLGRVVASAEVVINGKPAGIKVSSPWKYDITGKLETGQNRIEVLVYNTLGNHYLTTPSMYVGRTNSGMIGPVIIEFH